MLEGGRAIEQDYNFDKMIAGQEKYDPDKKFLNKFEYFGGGLGPKAMQTAAILYVSLRSPDMSKMNKMIVLAALVYFTV